MDQRDMDRRWNLAVVGLGCVSETLPVSGRHSVNHFAFVASAAVFVWCLYRIGRLAYPPDFPGHLRGPCRCKPEVIRVDHAMNDVTKRVNRLT